MPGIIQNELNTRKSTDEILHSMSKIEQSPILLKTNFRNDADTMDRDIVTTVHHQNYILSSLCILFGISTWLPVNAIYAEIPNLIYDAPEKWNLASYFALLVQVANIAPVLYYCFRRKLVTSQSTLICTFLFVGTLSVFAIAFTYDKTNVIFGQLHSVYFFLFSIFIAMLGCISSVLFLPFMYRLPEQYLVPFFIGEGLSGLIPSTLAIFQGVGKQVCSAGTELYIQPLFSTFVFLLIIGFLMVLSTISFIYLNYFSNFVEKIEQPTQVKKYTEGSSERLTVQPLSVGFFVSLLLIQTAVNGFSNGILPSIQSYSCMPYGQEAYHWSVLLNQIISPVVMFCAFFLPLVSVQGLGISVTALVACITYEMLTAFMSPNPPLMGNIGGAITIVVVWMAGSGLIAYTKVSIAYIFRRRSEKGLINYGLVTQGGSALGAAISFIMVNYLELFNSVEETKCR